MKSKTGYFLVNTLTGKKTKYSTKKKAVEARKKLDTVKYKQTQKQIQKQNVIVNVNPPAPKRKTSGYVRKEPIVIQGSRMIQAVPTAMDIAYSAKVLNDREPPKTGLLEPNKQNYEPIVNDLFLKLMEQQKSKPVEVDENVFEPRVPFIPSSPEQKIDGATIEELKKGYYGTVASGLLRRKPTKAQREALERNK